MLVIRLDGLAYNFSPHEHELKVHSPIHGACTLIRQLERFTMAIEAYCVKCKAKKIMKDPVEGVTKNGKPITKGKCPDCGTTICRIGAAK